MGVRIHFLAATMVLALGSSVARADESGFEGGVRTGYGVPLGKAVDGAAADMNEGSSGIVPLWLDAGYRLNRNVFLGAYFQYGVGFVGSLFEDACDLDGVDCATDSVRLGAQVHYHFLPEGSGDPWLGYGFGYEWWNLSVEGPGGKVSATSSGFEFANFQGGVDFYPAPHFYLGPFLSFSLDQFDSLDAECTGLPAEACAAFDESIDAKTLHHWFVFGIRGGFTAFSP